MTRRERLEMVIANTITDELIEECKAELVKMDEANAKQRLTQERQRTPKLWKRLSVLLVGLMNQCRLTQLLRVLESRV